MTIEEAIKLLHPETTGEGIMELECYGGFEAKEKVINAIEEACILACEALEKQIPYKPKEYEDKYYSCKCRNAVLMKYKKYPTELMPKKFGLDFCLCCGQKIDWKVEE